MNPINEDHDYGKLTAETVREFARGLAEHLTITAEKFKREVQSAADANIAWATQLETQCKIFADQVVAEAEERAKTTEAFFQHMTEAGKIFSQGIDGFGNAVSQIRTVSNAPFGPLNPGANSPFETTEALKLQQYHGIESALEQAMLHGDKSNKG